MQIFPRPDHPNSDGLDDKANRLAANLQAASLKHARDPREVALNQISRLETAAAQIYLRAAGHTDLYRELLRESEHHGRDRAALDLLDQVWPANPISLRLFATSRKVLQLPAQIATLFRTSPKRLEIAKQYRQVRDYMDQTNRADRPVGLIVYFPNDPDPLVLRQGFVDLETSGFLLRVPFEDGQHLWLESLKSLGFFVRDRLGV